MPLFAIRVPKSKLHLSPFSPAPFVSNQPPPVGSVIASLCSWLITFSSWSVTSPFGLLVASPLLQWLEAKPMYGSFAQSVRPCPPMLNELW